VSQQSTCLGARLIRYHHLRKKAWRQRRCPRSTGGAAGRSKRTARWKWDPGKEQPGLLEHELTSEWTMSSSFIAQPPCADVSTANDTPLLMPPTCAPCVKERLPIGSLCPHQKSKTLDQTSPNPRKKARTQSLAVGKPTDPILDTPTRRKRPGVESRDRTEEKTSMHSNY